MDLDLSRTGNTYDKACLDGASSLDVIFFDKDNKAETVAGKPEPPEDQSSTLESTVPS